MARDPQIPNEAGLDELFPIPSGKDAPPNLSSEDEARLVDLIQRIKGFPSNQPLADGYLDSCLVAYTYFKDRKAEEQGATAAHESELLEDIKKASDKTGESILRLLKAGKANHLEAALKDYQGQLPAWVKKDWEPTTTSFMSLLSILSSSALTGAKSCRRGPGRPPDQPRLEFLFKLVDEFCVHAGCLPPRSRNSNFHVFILEFLACVGQDADDWSRQVRAAVKEHPGSL